ncbi:MAG: cupin domain-containing protein [Actinobacteria bacterium]|nr:cupin domain-containing protein [Actinomycetota bacterium]
MSSVRVIALEDVDPVELPRGSWSRILIGSATVDGNTSSLGYSVFTPGTETDDLSHAVEELAFVVSGNGVLRMEDEVVVLGAGSAAFIPAGLWHTVANTGDEDLVMVFTFPDHGYPATERGPARTSSNGGV